MALNDPYFERYLVTIGAPKERDCREENLQDDNNSLVFSLSVFLNSTNHNTTTPTTNNQQHNTSIISNAQG